MTNKSSPFFPGVHDATVSAEALRHGHTPVSLRQHVVGVLRAAILQGVFQPGEQLSDRRLCEFTGASRSLIRESIRQLESEGYISAQPFRRPAVANLSWAELMSLLELREALEPQAASLAAMRATQEHIDRMDSALKQLALANASAIARERLAAKDLFYGVLLESISSNEIAAAIARAHQRMKLARLAVISTLERAGEALAELQAIHLAISSRDQESAREAAVAHIRAATSSIVRLHSAEASH